MTLASSPVATMLPVSELDRAREFYSERLSLPYAGTNPEGSLRYSLAGGSTLVLMERPAGTQSVHTTMSFEVDAIEREVADLESRGVEFVDYDLPDLKTVDHICVMGAEKAAWFQDPDGNYLCLHQGSQP